MPRYEYRCADCGEVFEVILTLREHAEGKVACPGCKSEKVEKRPASFYAVTSKKS